MRRPKGIKTKNRSPNDLRSPPKGKVMVRHSGTRHLLSGKSASAAAVLENGRN